MNFFAKEATNAKNIFISNTFLGSCFCAQVSGENTKCKKKCP